MSESNITFPERLVIQYQSGTKLSKSAGHTITRIEGAKLTGNRCTLEQLNNLNFKVVEFDHFRMQAGLSTFVLSAEQYHADSSGAKPKSTHSAASSVEVLVF